MNEARKVAPVLALDIGNVSLAIDPKPLLDEIGFESLEEFHEFDAGGEIWAGLMAFEEGRTTVEAFRNWLPHVFPKKFNPNDVDRVWGLLLRDEIDGMLEIVEKAIECDVKPVFLSDICPIRYQMTIERLSFAHLVEDAVLSYEVGRHKPHVTMFEAMERRFCGGGVPLLYADDLEANVQAARARGWRAYRFGNVEELMAELNDSLEALR